MPAAAVEPRSFARDQHSISRKHISANALRVLYRLREAGFSGYLVGGAVRDLLIGREPKDFDVATDATPEQCRQLFRNCRLIGRRFRLAHVMFGPEIIEVATFRANAAGDPEEDSEHVSESGRILRDNVYGSIEDDAVRRDFTCNALYYTIEDFSVRDFVGGFEDCRDRVLRLIGDPETRYREDPVRMLRAARLSAKLDFSIEPGSEAPIRSLGHLLGEASNARLFDESQKLFLSGHGQASLAALQRLGLLAVIMPDVHAALTSDTSGLCQQMLERAMANTDQRVAEGKPVTPAYLFAALLWPVYAAGVQAMIAEGHALAVAEQRAADRAILRQCQHIAIPRRFSQQMEEIWFMQTRMQHRQRKRVMRLLAHPRFRAAYDFLELRASIVPQLADELAFWESMQGEQRDVVLDASGAPSGDGPRKPRRRRRKRTAASGG
ncbi:polynucleotide adenylyltransferase PcnB [Lysobacter sp. CAU 1642]|uniref:Poly(A) polymerase I n=2 Tax=Pseudomarimonas salicorniae TaxID=2933270 RepID=A0ABT0GLM0_9GAMM|nr:polynucleotide adenylyltransferase PcnB [Lysobacter sp. CAU 1642]MCK7595443.1 polynucleotide adenylyltransferase PcnB [Lysobacter sp. CAU 1642]